MRFVVREAFIEPLDLEMFVVVVRTALEPSLRKFDVLQFTSMSVPVPCAIVEVETLRSYCVRHIVMIPVEN